MAHQEPAKSPTHSGEPPRRNFLAEAAAVVIGGLTTLIPAGFGAAFFLHPLLKKSSSGATDAGDGFRKIGTLGNLVPGGAPQLFQVKGTKQDAWTTYGETELGAVYVRLNDDGTPTGKPSCFNARCPHLGCTVDYKATQETYVCPCHDSSFTLEGERSNDIPPRNMDPLEIEIRNDNEVWVKFQNFRAGTEERTPIV